MQGPLFESQLKKSEISKTNFKEPLKPLADVVSKAGLSSVLDWSCHVSDRLCQLHPIAWYPKGLVTNAVLH